MTTSLPGDLSAALEGVLEGARTAELTRAVDRLVAGYRAAAPGGAQLTGAEVLAYAAYRMPATYGAVRAAAAAAAQVAPSWAPRSLLDVGGGTGAATWALAEAFPSIATVTVVEPDRAMADLGRRLAGQARSSAVRAAAWTEGDLTEEAALPAADLVVVSYALGEVPGPARPAAVRRLVAAAGTVMVVEPGTPVGYRTVLGARDGLVAAGWKVAAPCPHSFDCPLRATTDWCHFAVRLERSPLHRRIKRGALGFEDEKFSFVVASAGPVTPALGRVLRHPLRRKGHTVLRVCAAYGQVVDTTVAKSHGDAYRAARDATWGDPWPP